MTPSEVETMLENLNTRTTAIEQILPTLVTKEDLKKGLDGVEARLGARIDGVEVGLGGRIDGVETRLMTLHEGLRGDYKMLAEHLANVPTEIRELHEKVAVIPELRDDIRRLTQQGAGVKGDIQRLAEQISGLARKIDGSPRRRR
ncbi:MAG: hypothetical protein Q7J25_09010 [Vicinamibacterales bacterium]|nr:hypothetical protein [Vicinamibacterales bacterium]